MAALECEKRARVPRAVDPGSRRYRRFSDRRGEVELFSSFFLSGTKQVHRPQSTHCSHGTCRKGRPVLLNSATRKISS